MTRRPSRRRPAEPGVRQGILYLLKEREERLLMAVGSGRIPLNAAITIAGAGTDDKSVQAALQEAYESGKLRGSQLIQARRVIERRRTQGRSIGRMPSRKPNEDVTTSSLVRNYQREVERQKLLVRKAETAQRNLLFIVGALRQLLADEEFHQPTACRRPGHPAAVSGGSSLGTRERGVTKPPLGFVPEPLLLPLSAVLPSRKTPEGLATSRKFKQIIASMRPSA